MTNPPEPVGPAGAEAQFRLLVEAVTGYAIYMLDPAGQVATWNAGAQRINGYGAAEIIGKSFQVFYTQEDRAAGLPVRALQTASRGGRFETKGWRVRKDGTRFWASALLDAIRDESGTLIGFAEITRDISERRLTQEALERTREALFQSQKMEAIGQLSGGIAHDFNNLLTVITGNLELALQRPEGEGLRRLIMNAMSASDRGARLTQQLLSFARRQSLRPQLSSINRLLGGCEAVLRRACGEAVEMTLDLDPAVRATMIDVSQFESALLNLAMNARDAMPQGGTLTLSTANAAIDPVAAEDLAIAPGPYVRVTIADSGEGMSQETMARAFEPFFTTKPVGQGSGLGLSQVYGYVRQLGGAASIESAPGQGTKIILLLPADTTGAKVEGTPLAASLPGAGLATVLVVEDDPDVLSLAVETLRGLDYEVVTADDAPSALAILKRREDIDILFSDIVMPRGMSGVELAREASRLRPSLRVLLASGYAMPSFLADEQEGGDFAFIGKPYRGADLGHVLRSLMAG